MRSFAGNSELTEAQLREASIHWPRPSVLEVSLTALEGVGPKLADAAAEAGISTVGALLLRFPHSHRDRTVVPVAEVDVGAKATLQVEVLDAKPSNFRRRGLSILSVKVGDESGSIRATWFNQPWVAQKLTPGTRLLLTGSRDKPGFRVSEYELLTPPAGGAVAGVPHGGGRREAASEHMGEGRRDRTRGPETPSLMPVHPATEQLKAQRIRQWVEQAIRWAGNMPEPLPAELRVRRGLAGVADSVKAVHFPECEADVEQARQRLAFEELFLYQAILTTRKRT
ncbi:MAG TPA: OB-fold nucleic acid binding domain-containing protein, partial [Solirubrobacterales bacterium]